LHKCKYIDNLKVLNDEKPVEHYSFNYNLYECHKSLRLAKAWLGKVLGELGEESPYKNDGKRKEVKDIEDTTDTAKDVTDFPVVPDHWPDDLDKVPYVEKIDFLREQIKSILSQFHELRMQKLRYFYDANIFVSQNHISEARFHLGFELQRIKEREEQ